MTQRLFLEKKHTCKDCAHYFPSFVGGMEIGRCVKIEQAHSYTATEPKSGTLEVNPCDEICSYYEE